MAFIVKMEHRYITNQEPGLVHYTTDRKQATPFECPDEARETHRWNFPEWPCELIHVPDESPK